ncbi:hypothetical protein C7I85_18405 [Mesorhizobium soli]|uniref:Uncharacterized protein n=1 Tax=Pseudaminobacter soli (ex Li et al. 2025) TaxID=1295366 RepID=A0A2P7S8Y0_9HYPH|nr:hypothetical protein C7I85_18405 [Mesorhizobium soli]
MMSGTQRASRFERGSASVQEMDGGLGWGAAIAPRKGSSLEGRGDVTVMSGKAAARGSGAQ